MRHLANLTGAVVMIALTGCVATSPDWDARFGEAARMSAAQQIIAPEASLDTSPVHGIDGKAAQGAMGEYQNSFVQPEPAPPSFSIGVGGQSGK